MEAIAWRDAGVQMLEALRDKVSQWVVLTSVSLAASLSGKPQLELKEGCRAEGVEAVPPLAQALRPPVHMARDVVTCKQYARVCPL